MFFSPCWVAISTSGMTWSSSCHCNLACDRAAGVSVGALTWPRKELLVNNEKRRLRDTVELIVQFPLQGAWGDNEQNRAYYHTADILGALFYHTELGALDGTDTGGGKLNIYI